MMLLLVVVFLILLGVVRLMCLAVMAQCTVVKQVDFSFREGLSIFFFLQESLRRHLIVYGYWIIRHLEVKKIRFRPIHVSLWTHLGSSPLSTIVVQYTGEFDLLSL